MQSRRTWLPEVAAPASFADVVGVLGATAAALAHPGGAPPSLERPAILVGPEGGFAPEELAAGLPTVDLGPTVLRAETAAVAAGLALVWLRSGVVGPA
jgi:16S rRNA (uracil1498-N3)-methyltransferase